jgi:hypothetical protein
MNVCGLSHGGGRDFFTLLHSVEIRILQWVAWVISVGAMRPLRNRLIRSSGAEIKNA